MSIEEECGVRAIIGLPESESVGKNVPTPHKCKLYVYIYMFFMYRVQSSAK